jgi:hypothetical protein
MTSNEKITIRMFGSLHGWQRERGLPSTLELKLGADGRPALEIAGEIGVPIEKIGGVYCNHQPSGLLRRIVPGDRLAFVPRSIPGPHDSLLGLPVAPD